MKNFLNYTNDLFDAYDRAEQLGDIYDVNKAREDMQGKLAEAITFYSQPFKPELITELFEGWKLEEEHYYSNTEPVVLIFVNIGHQGHTLVVGRREYEIEFSWVTLNDFISDCSRAGISLELKAEIKEKYGL